MKNTYWFADIMKNLLSFFKDVVMVPVKEEVPVVLKEKEVVVEKPIVQPVKPTTLNVKDIKKPVITPREKLYETSKALLQPARDVSPRDIAPDDLACCESAWNVIDTAFPGKVGFPMKYNTIEFYKSLKASTQYWLEVFTPLPGDVQLVVTGTGKSFYHGHIGVRGMYQMMSNNSRNGIWDTAFTIAGWDHYYLEEGGFKNHFFRRISG